MINLVFSGIMILLTFTGAIIFAFTNLFEDRAYGGKRIVLAVVFLAYSIYRSYRTYNAYNSNKE